MNCDLASRIARAEDAIATAEAELQRIRDEAASARKGSARVVHMEGSCATAIEILGHLRRDGVVAVERLAPHEQMDALAEELAQLAPYAYRGEDGSFAGAGTTRNGSYLVSSCPTSQQLAMHPLLIEVAEGLLAPYARRIALAVASEIRVEGSSPAQVLHRDDEEWPLDLLAMKRPGAELELECMWAVSDFVQEGGATCHVPGSHLWPGSRKPDPDEIVPVPMPRGSVLLWVGSALHGAGASVPTAGTRHGLLLGYCLSWLRPEMNMHFSCPSHVAAAMDPRMSALLGFAGSNRYGPHPFISGPIYAAEYNGYPDTVADLGAVAEPTADRNDGQRDASMKPKL
jgi:hypothetical protein